MKYPAELYRPSTRPYPGLPELEYPSHDRTVMVTLCGRLCLGTRRINLSTVFAGQSVGVREVAERIWLISFIHCDLGYFRSRVRAHRRQSDWRDCAATITPT
jgi:hypothetical protein